MSDYFENFKDALPDIKKVKQLKKQLEKKGVKYIYSNWIDFLGSPKTKPMPISDFEDLCMGKGPQFAVHSVSFVPELTPQTMIKYHYLIWIVLLFAHGIKHVLGYSQICIGMTNLTMYVQE